MRLLWPVPYPEAPRTSLGFRVQGLGVRGLGFRVWAFWGKVWALGAEVWDPTLGVQEP